MADLRTIKAPIQAEIDEFQGYFRKYLKSDTRLLDLLMFYLLKQKGKQIRPMLVFLTAKLYDKITEHTFRAAALIELMHTASLVHDDVVDEADKRRGFWSINAIWKNKVAVLAGDYLLAKGLQLANESHEYQLLDIISKAVGEMSEGELLQIEKARHLNIDEQTYYEVIKKKTAALMVACTTAGAVSAGANETNVELMRQLGENIGIAFQIRDDLFDYEVDGIFGKPAGNDLRERKITLPLIYALHNCQASDRRWAIKTLRKKEKTDDDIAQLMQFVRERGGLEYAEKAMVRFAEKCKEILNNAPDNEAHKSLSDLIDYTVSRKK
ncbi:MAG: polyprenyl synthetase family protein [Salinivirgaceae bacterium]|nr:polyprenyl synthetase family protein [Salinivirgaceae bacterium]